MKAAKGGACRPWLAVAGAAGLLLVSVSAAAQEATDGVQWTPQTTTWDLPWLTAGWQPAGWEQGRTACAGLDVVFTAPSGSAHWDFGDGRNMTLGPEQSVAHRYALPGTYDVLVQGLDGPTAQFSSSASGTQGNDAGAPPGTWQAHVHAIDCAVPPPPNGCPLPGMESRFLTARPGTWVSFTVQARDDNPYSAPDPGLVLTMAVTSPPPASAPSFTVSDDGTVGTFSWHTALRDEGLNLHLLLRASDGICDTTGFVTIHVSSLAQGSAVPPAAGVPCAGSPPGCAPQGPVLPSTATQAKFPDADQDGIADPADNCPAVPNWEQADLDGDTMGDDCDADLDGDSVANGLAGVAPQGAVLDNCPYLPNSDQADLDHDGTGDACLTPAVAAPVRANGPGVAPSIANVASAKSVQMAMLTLAALAAVAAGAASGWWRRVPLFGVFLFSRLRTSDLARHPGRAALLEAIAANPGASLATLQALTGMSRSVAAHHLKTLVRGGLVRRHEWMGTVGFHPARHEPSMGVHMVRVDPTSLDAYAALRSPTARQLVEALVQEPGRTLQ
ncbi:MAG: thrombospondin type 3 repeat-containing protein, partial [Halobacteriales archaeon]|nr:thrombospondin type 3 repeat-containing protein [Halobacteriales archaeon]